MKVLIALPLIFLALGLGSAALQSQEEARADVLSGRVTDLAGHPVADAQVGATAVGSGITRTTSTDGAGHYRLFFPKTARQYVVLVKRMGFTPVQRTVTRRTNGPEEMTIDLQLGGAPLALSMVEITGESASPLPPPRSHDESRPGKDATVPNPVAEILAMRDTLHLSAVQVVGLTDVADSLQVKNTRIYGNIRTLLAKSQEAGDAGQMAGSVAIMLEEASGNTAKAVTAAEKLLRPEQWQVLPQAIRDLLQTTSADAAKQ
jgi:hypothetical protein